MSAAQSQVLLAHDQRSEDEPVTVVEAVGAMSEEGLTHRGDQRCQLA